MRKRASETANTISRQPSGKAFVVAEAATILISIEARFALAAANKYKNDGRMGAQAGF